MLSRKNKILCCCLRDDVLPELEVRVDHPVGETFTANTDAFKHTVTGELVHHKVGVDETWQTKTLSSLEKYSLEAPTYTIKIHKQRFDDIIHSSICTNFITATHAHVLSSLVSKYFHGDTF